ncbi:hypothetical protein [Paracoccus sp. SM22M-07]|uniref:hypothetical protein n=1 Tax=Paracoccus sp. SM22M-07 TaxID=1520813 RepID=UPI00091EA72C|nr:hypothetical protein [Paracoccus sp. SM22M-07]OJH45175.1 hypothetical protein IE00_05795 [Paracoccus sp. SM22M-07]
MITVRGTRFPDEQAVADHFGIQRESVRTYIARHGHADGVGAKQRYPRESVDAAEAWIIETAEATFADAAARFGISVYAIRSRIFHHYGTLADARRGGRRRFLVPVRRCLCCSESFASRDDKRICPKCTKRNAGVHDGGA